MDSEYFDVERQYAAPSLGVEIDRHGVVSHLAGFSALVQEGERWYARGSYVYACRR